MARWVVLLVVLVRVVMNADQSGRRPCRRCDRREADSVLEAKMRTVGADDVVVDFCLSSASTLLSSEDEEEESESESLSGSLLSESSEELLSESLSELLSLESDAGFLFLVEACFAC